MMLKYSTSMRAKALGVAPKISRLSLALQLCNCFGLWNMSFPYSYFSCPCAASSGSEEVNPAGESSDQDDENDDAEKTFDPRSPRSNFSLYPLDHLMWCEDCHDIRCPRCTIEEIVCWFCPNCFFEVTSNAAKSEGNR